MILKFLAHTPRGEGINGNELRHIVFYANQPRPFLFTKTTLIFEKRISNCSEGFVPDYFTFGIVSIRCILHLALLAQYLH